MVQGFLPNEETEYGGESRVARADYFFRFPFLSHAPLSSLSPAYRRPVFRP